MGHYFLDIQFKARLNGLSLPISSFYFNCTPVFSIPSFILTHTYQLIWWQYPDVCVALTMAWPSFVFVERHVHPAHTPPFQNAVGVLSQHCPCSSYRQPSDALANLAATAPVAEEGCPFLPDPKLLRIFSRVSIIMTLSWKSDGWSRISSIISASSASTSSSSEHLSLPCTI